MGKLQKLIKKFRFWLIKKLGGCTTEIKYRTPESVTLTATLRKCLWSEVYSLDHPRGKSYVTEKIMEELINRIAYDIKTKKLYKFDKHEDTETEDMIYRLQVNVVEPL